MTFIMKSIFLLVPTLRGAGFMYERRSTCFCASPNFSIQFLFNPITLIQPSSPLVGGVALKVHSQEHP